MLGPNEKQAISDPSATQKFQRNEKLKREMETRIEAQLKYLIRARKFSYVCQTTHMGNLGIKVHKSFYVDFDANPYSESIFK